MANSQDPEPQPAEDTDAPHARGGVSAALVRIVLQLAGSFVAVASQEAQAGQQALLRALVSLMFILFGVSLALLLGHALAVIGLHHWLPGSWARSLAMVAGADLLFALLGLLALRRALRTPLFPKTRHALARALHILFGR